MKFFIEPSREPIMSPKYSTQDPIFKYLSLERIDPLMCENYDL